MAKPISEYEESFLPYMDLEAFAKAILRGEFNGTLEGVRSDIQRTAQASAIDVKGGDKSSVDNRFTEIAGLMGISLALHMRVQQGALNESDIVAAFVFGKLASNASFRPLEKAAVIGDKILSNNPREDRATLRAEAKSVLEKHTTENRKKTVAVKLACEELGISRATLYNRLK